MSMWKQAIVTCLKETIIVFLIKAVFIELLLTPSSPAILADLTGLNTDIFD